MRYNRKHEIIYLDERTYSNDFFCLAMAGKTLPNPNYIINHSYKDGSVWDKYNFEYVLSGKGYIETRDKTYCVGEGDLFFLNKLQQHVYYADRKEPYEKLFLVVSGSLVDSLLADHGVTESVIVAHTDAKAIFEQAFALIEKANGQLSQNDYTELTCHVLRLVQRIAPPDFTLCATDAHPADLIRNYIDHNIYERFTLEELANTVHRSVSQTERLFKAKYGVSTIRYVLDKKLDAAHALFMTTFLNVGEVAERLSFANVKYFSRQFKLRFGQTPSEYIRNQEKNPFSRKSDQD